MDKITINFDVFSSFMEDIIVRNLNGILVIIIKRSSKGCRHTEIFKKPLKPEEFECGISKGTIFHFSARAGHNGLFLVSPRNQRRTKKKAITSGRTSISEISCPIGI